MNAISEALLAEAAGQVTVLPKYQFNRIRVAAAVDVAYEGLETYDRWKPTIFAASVAGLVISGAALARRVRTPEALALYGIAGAISAASAWFTRPQWLLPPPPPTIVADPNAPSSLNLLLGRLDARAAYKTEHYPGWEGATLTRLATDLGMGTMNPVVATLLTRNAR